VTIKKFLLFSVVFHLVLFLGVYFVPEPKIKKAREFITSLVSPEELKKPEIRVKPLQIPVPKPVPRQKAFPSPLPALRPLKRIIPSRPPLPLEEPVVQGEGKESGKPLPEGVRPKESEGGKSGGTKEAGDARDTKNAVEPGKPGFSVRGSLKEITEAVAKRDSSGPGSRAKKDDTITFDTEDYRYAGYMRLLRQKIESIWEYPPEEASKGHYGDLKIRFTIKKDGRLGEIHIVQHSGYPSLDQAAEKALRDGEPYWPLPDNWGKDSYTITGHFIYLYGENHLR